EVGHDPEAGVAGRARVLQLERRAPGVGPGAEAVPMHVHPDARYEPETGVVAKVDDRGGVAAAVRSGRKGVVSLDVPGPAVKERVGAVGEVGGRAVEVVQPGQRAQVSFDVVPAKPTDQPHTDARAAFAAEGGDVVSTVQVDPDFLRLVGKEQTRSEEHT